jgi:hypothetical protein
LGEVFAFLSGLYFRGKALYAERFARPPRGTIGAHVITATRGLLPIASVVTGHDLQVFDSIDIDPGEPRYAAPLRASALRLAETLPARTEIVLLGSIASDKYTRVLLPIFAERLLFPGSFVGRGDMSRGGLMLRSVRSGDELEYISVEGASGAASGHRGSERSDRNSRWRCVSASKARLSAIGEFPMPRVSSVTSGNSLLFEHATALRAAPGADALSRRDRPACGTWLAVRAQVGWVPNAGVSDRDELLLQSRDQKPMNRYFPELLAPLAAALPKRCVSGRRDRHRRREWARLRSASVAHPSGSLASATPGRDVAGLVRAWDLLALAGEDLRDVPLAERRARLERCSKCRRTAASLASDSRSHAGAGLVRALRGRRTGWRDGEAARCAVHSRPAHDDQGEAHAYRRLRRRRFPLAQERPGYQVGSSAARPL